MIKLAVISCGYIESNQISIIPFQYLRGSFKTKKDAAASLALQLLNTYLGYDDNYVGSSCCTQHRGHNSIWKYCPKCGTRLQIELDFEDFSDWITRLHNYTNDDFGDFGDFGYWEVVGWKEVKKFSSTKTLVIEECAEAILPRCLDHNLLQERERDTVFPTLADSWARWYVANTGYHDPSDLAVDSYLWPKDWDVNLVKERQSKYIKYHLK